MFHHTPLATLLLTAACLVLPLSGRAAESNSLPTNARVAVIGDSITEQKLYSKYIETYLLAVEGRQDVRVCQFGWSGETAGGFLGRMKNDLAVFQPTIATLCYGMNDGTYRPFEESIGKRYGDAMRGILANFKETNTRVIVGTPGAVDTKFFVKPSFAAANPAQSYNESLEQLGKIGRSLANEFHQGFADVHGPMMDSMSKAKKTLGENYDVCGSDGVHPAANGQLIMAYAFLKGLGCEGKVGELQVDYAGKASASTGHKVLGYASGKLEVESQKYPFCFEGDPKASNGTRSILPFLPFNQDLNRFTLKVTNFTASKAKVTWGSESREFTKEQLSAGINLAAEFSSTPFDEPFKKVMGAVAAKQAFETGMIKGMITGFRMFQAESQRDPEWKTIFEKLTGKLSSRHKELEADVHKTIAPVKHTLTITAI